MHLVFNPFVDAGPVVDGGLGVDNRNVSYSSCAELKKAQTCRCSRRVNQANGIGSAEKLMAFVLSKVAFAARRLLRRRLGVG
jgi:hypothetical protein